MDLVEFLLKLIEIDTGQGGYCVIPVIMICLIIIISYILTANLTVK